MTQSADLPFDVRVSQSGDATVLAFEGDLDLISVPMADEALERAQAGGGTVVLDLRTLRFIDSSGLRVVLTAQRRASQDGTRLLVAPGVAGVRRVFDLSGVGALIELIDAPPDAG